MHFIIFIYRKKFLILILETLNLHISEHSIFFGNLSAKYISILSKIIFHVCARVCAPVFMLTFPQISKWLPFNLQAQRHAQIHFHFIELWFLYLIIASCIKYDMWDMRWQNILCIHFVIAKLFQKPIVPILVQLLILLPLAKHNMIILIFYRNATKRV